jgi:hypothetical protein
MMDDFAHPASDAAGASPASAAGQKSPRLPFLGHPNVGWLVATKVEQTPSRYESHIPGLFVVPYRVAFQAKEILPPVTPSAFIVMGAKGEGLEAGALGLQDWLPSKAGDECVVAFDAQRAGSAKEMTYLGGGQTADSSWRDARRFYESLKAGSTLDADDVVAAMAKMPRPRATFFQLVFDYDRGVYQNPAVGRALAAYLASEQVPALDRRTTVAHYLGQPGGQDAGTLRDLAGGMLQLALHLAAEGQAASAGAVLQRVYGYAFDPGTGAARVGRPALTESQRVALVQLLGAPEVSLSGEVFRSLRDWIGQ